MDNVIRPLLTEEETNRIRAALDTGYLGPAIDRRIDDKLVAAIEAAKRPRFYHRPFTQSRR